MVIARVNVELRLKYWNYPVTATRIEPGKTEESECDSHAVHIEVQRSGHIAYPDYL